MYLYLLFFSIGKLNMYQGWLPVAFILL